MTDDSEGKESAISKFKKGGKKPPKPRVGKHADSFEAGLHASEVLESSPTVLGGANKEESIKDRLIKAAGGVAGSLEAAVKAIEEKKETAAEEAKRVIEEAKQEREKAKLAEEESERTMLGNNVKAEIQARKKEMADLAAQRAQTAAEAESDESERKAKASSEHSMAFSSPEESRKSMEKFKAKLAAFEPPEKKKADMKEVGAFSEKKDKDIPDAKSSPKEREGKIAVPQAQSAKDETPVKASTNEKAVEEAIRVIKEREAFWEQEKEERKREEAAESVKRQAAAKEKPKDKESGKLGDTSSEKPELSKGALRAKNDFAELKRDFDFDDMKKKMQGFGVQNSDNGKGERKPQIKIKGYEPTKSIKERGKELAKNHPSSHHLSSGKDGANKPKTKTQDNKKVEAILATALYDASQAKDSKKERPMPEFPSVPQKFNESNASWKKFAEQILDYPETQTTIIVESNVRAKENAKIMVNNATHVAKSMEPLVKAKYDTHLGGTDGDDGRKTYTVNPTKRGPVYMPRKDQFGKSIKEGGNVVYDVLFYERRGGKLELNLDKSFIAPDDVPKGSKCSVTKDIREEVWKYHEQRFEKELGLNKPKAASMKHSPEDVRIAEVAKASAKHVVPEPISVETPGKGLSRAETEMAAVKAVKPIPPPLPAAHPKGGNDPDSIKEGYKKGMKNHTKDLKDRPKDLRTELEAKFKARGGAVDSDK